MKKPLEPEKYYRKCAVDSLSFDTTAELEHLDEFIGQARALGAIEFGSGVRHEGYNLFVLGPHGSGKRAMVTQFLEKKALNEPEPWDWCYINNFDKAHKPLALKLPHGLGEKFAAAMEQLVEELRTAIPAAFDADDYRNKAEAIQNEFNRRQEDAFKNMGKQAENQNVALLRTPEGFAFAPMSKDAVIPPEEYEKLDEEEKQRIEKVIQLLQEDLQKVVRQIPKWRKENREKIKELNRETTKLAVDHLIEDLRAKYADFADVLRYLDAVSDDVIENAKDFLKTEEKGNALILSMMERPTFERYQVNVLGNHHDARGAPIVFEDNPSYSNLVGRVEHVAQLGALVTNFTLIKPGALHKANGGYLLLNVLKVLTQPYAWEGLKRALNSREIRIESLGQMLSLVSTVSLEPEPIPLDVKVVLFGDRLFYYLLNAYDPEFGTLFKVAADFEDRVERNADNDLLYARLIATIAGKESLLPFTREAVGRVIEYCSRVSGDAERLATHIQSVADLLCEADFWAKSAKQDTVALENVEHAIDAQIHRADRLKSRVHEEILRGTIMIDTDGEVVAQVNALSVIQLGNFAFGQPTRITATARVGDGELVNIEREAKLSGAIHSKGVLILSSFLASRYAKNQPFSLAASLVFEQSYGMVDGDSASLAELCALLSELSSSPIRQSLAMTGSVNQFGQVQPIGGVNEKIEGFFDICAARGLNGKHGVLIPAQNVKHLMLKKEVVLAAEQGKFHIWPVETVDQAMEVLTGMEAPGINSKVEARLIELTNIRKAFAAAAKGEKNPEQ